jgi:hypothetical protein
VNAQHARQAILPDASGVHSQLKIWVNISIQGQRIRSLIVGYSLLRKAEEAVTAPSLWQSVCQTRRSYLSTYC